MKDQMIQFQHQVNLSRILGWMILSLLWGCSSSNQEHQLPKHSENKNHTTHSNHDISGSSKNKDLHHHPILELDEIINSLDLNHPGLEKVRHYVSIGDDENTLEELLLYYKNKLIPKAKVIKNLSKKDQSHADLALKHYFSGNKNYEPSFRGDDIDWFSEAIIDGKKIRDREWLFQYHRLTWWTSLARAYSYTKDERYAKEWIHELKDYTNTILPLKRKKTPWFIERGMEVYYRCLRLTYALPYFIQSQHFGTEELLYSLFFIHDHAKHLPKVFAKKGNHLIGDLTSCFKNGLNFPEFKLAKTWRDIALKRVPEEMFKNIYPDGMNKELVFSYHTMYCNLFQEFLQLVKENGYQDSIPQSYNDLLEKMYTFTIPFTYPDMSFPQVGDGWKKPGYYKKFYRQAKQLYPDNQAFEYIYSKGDSGQPPKQLNHNFPISGFYTMRSAWDRTGIFMMLKNGDPAEFHNQIDNGTFVLWAYGRDFMNDSGCYIYSSHDPEDQKQRAWFRSSLAHQNLTLDEKNITRKPTYILSEERDGLDILIVENQSYPDLKHRRTVLFIDKSYFIIHDEASGDAEGRIEAHFQLAPMPVILSKENLMVSSNNPKGANIIVKAMNPSRELSMAKKEGWISYQYGKKQERPAWSYQKNKTSGESITFTTLIYPFKDHDRSAIPTDINITTDGEYQSVNIIKDNQSIKTFTIKTESVLGDN
jgi:heparan-sulfate lyase